MVVGGSAGSLNSLKSLLRDFDPDIPATVVIIRHYSDEQTSKLDELLQVETSLPVQWAEIGSPLDSKVVYLAEPGRDLNIENGVFATLDSNEGAKPSIDRFFRAAANTFEDRAIGVIVSGTGRDGARGLAAIRDRGGTVIVEDPRGSSFGEMPAAAIASVGVVDQISAASELGKVVSRLARRHLETLNRQYDPKLISAIVAQVSAVDGVDFEGYKRSTIERRVLRRLSLSTCENLSEYAERVRTSDEEVRALHRDLLISVTEFLRDPESFASMRRAIAPTVAELQGALRAWVPACSTGQEAYSVAIALMEEAKRLDVEPQLNVFATDVDEQSIEIARKGRYALQSLADLPQSLLDSYFEVDGQVATVRQRLRDCIVFARQDVLRDPPFSRVQLISCRNLLIYLNATRQRHLFARFHYALAPRGVLMLGRSESVSAAPELFVADDAAHRIFRRVDRSPSLPRVPRPLRRPERMRRREREVGDLAALAIAKDFAPPGVVVNRDLDVVHVFGDLNGILQLPQGEAALGLLDLVGPGLRAPVHQTVGRAFETEAAVDTPHAMHRRGDETQYFHLWCKRLTSEDHVVLLFRRTGVRVSVQQTDDTLESARVQDLEHELEITRQQLRATTDELASANEDLESLNEELQSANEELQSSNEELETSNEELQATNEELRTVNEELTTRSRELSAVNRDLENVLAQMELALLVVDRNLRIRRRTPRAAALLDLDDAAFLSGADGLSTAASDLVRQLLDSGEPRSRDMSLDGKSYVVSVVPFVGDTSEPEAIVMFYDRTAEQARMREFEALVERAPDIIARFSADLRNLYVNRAMARYSDIPPSECVGTELRELGLPESLCELWESAVRDVFERGEEGQLRFSIPAKDGEAHVVETRLVPEFDESGRVLSVFGIGRDITALLAAEAARDESAYALRMLMETLPDAFFSLDRDLRVVFANGVARQTFGLDTDEPQEAVKTLLDGTFDIDIESLGRRVLGGAEPLSVRARRFNGAEHWYELRCMPVANGVALFVRDIQQSYDAEQNRERLERELSHAQKMEAMGTLAGGVAHEFNNVLAVISSYVEFLQSSENPGDGDWQRDLDIIANASRRGAELSQRMLTFSGGRPADLRPIDLNRAVRSAEALLKRTLPSVSVRSDLAPEPAVTIGDEHLVQQVILTLAANARDAMPDGGRLTLRTEVEQERVRLIVADTGTGIAPEIVDRVFEPFFTTKEPDQGTGLGLAMVYRLVTSLNGRIEVTSEVGRGTQFVLTFASSFGSVDDDGKLERRTAIDGAGRLVLVVDDEPALRVAFRRMLESLGFSVWIAKTGEEGIEFFDARREDVTLAIIDLNMPGLGGERTIEAIRSRAPTLPIILSSGYPGSASLTSDRGAHPVFKLQKPFSKAELLDAIRRVLEG